MAEKGSGWKIVLVVFGIAGLLVCGGGSALVIYLLSGPEGGVRAGNRVEPYALEYLEQHGLLQPGESIVVYYDVTVDLDASEAAILTDRRLVYHVGSRVTTLPVAEIVDVQRVDDGVLGERFVVVGASGALIEVVVAPLNGAETMHRALLDAWNRARAEAPKPPGG